MPNQFPKVPPMERPVSTGKVLFAGVLGIASAGAIYGLALWSALLLLRQQGAISEILSYRYCVLLSYLYVAVRLFDRNLFRDKGGHTPPSKG